MTKNPPDVLSCPDARVRSGRPAFCRLALLAAIVVLASATSGAGSEELPWTRLLEAGASYGDYDSSLGDLNGQFVRFSMSRYFHDRISLEIGRQDRFDDEGIGFGLNYSRHLRRDTILLGGVSTGTGDVLFPDLRLDAGLEHGLLANDNLIVSVGYTHSESKATNSYDGIHAGLRLYQGNWIGSVGGRVEVGHPGRTTSESLSASLTWGLYKKFYAGGGVDWGDVSYLLVAPNQALVNFRSLRYHASTTLHVRPEWGFGVDADYTDADFYNLWTTSLRLFYEW